MISPPVREFLAKYVSSAELLDILMLLYREQEPVWTPASVSNRVFTVPQAAERRLEELEAQGLVMRRPGHADAFCVDPTHPEVKATLPALREIYETNRAEVIGTVFKMRTDPLQSFSNAFRLRGDS